MAENSKIEWTDHTFNPWRGCTKVSPGCANCYAETLSKRNPKVLGEWGKGKPRVKAAPAMWRQPIKWNRTAQDDQSQVKDGMIFRMEIGWVPYRRPRVFCASLADWLDDEVPIEWLAKLMSLILATPDLDWLLLTKRPQNFHVRILAAALHAAGYRDGQTQYCQTAPPMAALCEMLGGWSKGETYPPNVWIGTSVEDQTRADERIPLLLAIPAKVRFLSCEPLLGPVELAPEMEGQRAPVGWLEAGCTDSNIDWVIAGGESGPNARPMHPLWVRGLRDQCEEAGVAFHFKQWGEWAPCPIGSGPDLVTNEVFKRGPGLDGEVWRVGKFKAGRVLDGRTWDELP